MKSFKVFILVIIASYQTYAQCNVCSGQPTTLTPTITGGASPFTHQWTCSNGFLSSSQNPTTSFTSSTNCNYSNTDANGCINTQSLSINVVPPAQYSITKTSCRTIVLNTIVSNGCTSFNLQQFVPTNPVGQQWQTVASNISFPYSLPATNCETDFRVQIVGCLCGSITTNTVQSCGSTLSYSPGCFMSLDGSCNRVGSFTVERSCDNGNTWSNFLVTNDLFFFVSDACCYRMSYTTSSSATCCSNVVCVAANQNCGSSCNCSISTTFASCSMGINWCTTCTTNGWFIERQNGSLWTVVSSGTSSPPSSYTIPSNGVYRARQTCTNNCSYISATQSYSSCGCSPVPNVTISQGTNPCISSTLITANVSNCSATNYLWSTGATSQAINVSSGTYMVTVSNCCQNTSSSITVTCNNPCSGFSTTINGATQLCSNASTTLTSSVSGGTTPYTYLWKINGVNSGTGSSLTLVGSNYTNGQNLAINLTVNSSNGCVSSDAHSVAIINCVDCVCTAPTLNINTSNCQLSWNVSGCTGWTASLQRLVSGTWTNISGTSPYTATVNGSYRILMTKSGCSDVASNTVTVNCVVDPCNCTSGTLNLDQTSCILSWNPSCPSGFTVLLQYDSGIGFNTVSGATSPYTVPTGANGSYRLFFTKTGCSSFSTNVQVVNCAPIACNCIGTLTKNGCVLTWTTCSGWTSQLQVLSGTTWTNVTATSPYTTNLSTDYRVKYTKSGCSDYVSNIVSATCSCTANPITFTGSANIVLCNDKTITTNGGYGPLTYSWTKTGNLTVQQLTPSSNNIIASSTEPNNVSGTYVVTVTDANTCTYNRTYNYNSCTHNRNTIAQATVTGGCYGATNPTTTNQPNIVFHIWRDCSYGYTVYREVRLTNANVTNYLITSVTNNLTNQNLNNVCSSSYATFGAGISNTNGYQNLAATNTFTFKVFEGGPTGTLIDTETITVNLSACQ